MGGRKQGRSRVDAFLGRPWLLVVAVAALVAAPVLVVGQASENDTRARLAAVQVESASHAAEVVSSDLNDRTALIGNALGALAVEPSPDASPIGLAVQRGDVATLQALADSVQLLYPRSVLRVYITVRGRADTIADGMIVAAAPAGAGLVGKRRSDLTPRAGAIPDLRLIFTATGFSDAYPGTADAPSRVMISAMVAEPGSQSSTGFTAAPSAMIEAEVDLARTFAEFAAPFLVGADDAYLLNGRRQLIGRARGPTAFPLRDLSDDPFVQLVRPPSYAVARVGAGDPLGSGARLIASTGFSGSDWSILVLRDTSAADLEVDAALRQLTVLRLVLVTMLLGLAYLAGLAGRQGTLRAVDQERLRLARDLHDLLGHSLSLITIKSQLARRLLPPGDGSPAATEIADVERVARESLQDVRHAIDGYRQPTLTAALIGARQTLVAAGIECTVDVAAGPLPPAVDAALAWAVREGVTNVARHSRASACAIRLIRDGHEARLEVVDDGPLTAGGPPGNGLRGLQERAAARGGQADAAPLPGGGFRLSVSLPLATP